MSATHLVTGVSFRPAREIDQRSGLLGWAQFGVGSLRIDGVAVRRTRLGRLALAYPTRRDGQDREHTIVLPRTLADEIEIERAVLAELERQGVLP